MARRARDSLPEVFRRQIETSCAAPWRPIHWSYGCFTVTLTLHRTACSQQIHLKARIIISELENTAILAAKTALVSFNTGGLLDKAEARKGTPSYEALWAGKTNLSVLRELDSA